MCETNKHSAKEFKCMTLTCKSTLCINCQPQPDMNNKVFCRLCRLLLSNINLAEESDEDDESVQDKKKSRHKRNTEVIMSEQLTPPRIPTDPNVANLHGYYVQQVDKFNFVLKHCSDEESKQQFPIVMRHHEKKVIFDGLPD